MLTRAILSILLFVNFALSQEISPQDAQLLLGRFSTDPEILDKLSDERRSRLSSSIDFRAAIVERYQRALASRNVTESIQLKRVVQRLFQDTDEFYRQFESLAQFGERLEHYLASENLAELRAILNDEALSKVERRIVETQFSNYIHSRAGELIKGRQLDKALELLSSLPAPMRSAETWVLSSQLITQLSSDPTLVNFLTLLQGEAYQLMIDFSEKDPGGKETFRRLITLGFLESGKRGDAVASKTALAILETFDSDLRPVFEQYLILANDAARAEIAPEIFLRLKNKGSFSLGTKLQLVLAGYYGPVVPALIFLSMAFPLLAVLLLVILKSQSKGKKEPRIPRSIKRKKELPGYLRPVEVESESEQDDEYSRLLRMFGLRDSASESDIKQAYRVKIKELHPDAGQVSADAENSEAFRELKHSYDRILEIRSSWFRGRRGRTEP